MTEDQFLQDATVQAFVTWLCDRIGEMEVSLDIRPSRFVPQGVQEPVTGLPGVVAHYRWRAVGTEQGTWDETVRVQSGLSDRLRRCINQRDDAGALAVCHDILSWGGNRDWSKGAWPFLVDRTSIAQASLCGYLENARDALALENAETTALSRSIQKMNAMLTKVHALIADDGLPIYDSRVAAAIAAIIELWRRDHDGANGNALPDHLTFPATDRSRTVQIVFPDAPDPGFIAGPAATGAWCSAKVRLGWLMRAVLPEPSELFGGGNRVDQMRRFEAALFMIGYDIRCLVRGQQGEGAADAAPGQLPRVDGNGAFPQDARTVDTLTGRGEQVHYRGSVAEGLTVQWGETTFDLGPELLAEILNEFRGCQGVPLGASQTNPTQGSLGAWLQSPPRRLSPRYASAIAPILVNEGYATAEGQHPVNLAFVG